MHHQTTLRQARLAMLLPVVLSALIPGISRAEFALNFMPQPTRLGDPEWLNFNCRRPPAPGGGFEKCDENDIFRENNGRDTTPFLMERIRDASGNQYYHTIIGLPGSDFVQEAYIKITRFMNKDGGMSSIPQIKVDDLGPISDSLGDWSDMDKKPDNADDPLGPARFSGSGTANPKSTQFRQVVQGGGLKQEIVKTHFNKKPLIVQTLNTPEVVHGFEIDMTNSTYDQATLAGVVKQNWQQLNSNGFSYDFDVNNMPYEGDSKVYVTGGKYKYVQKYTTSMIGTTFANEYEGEGSGYNIWTEMWMAWRDPAQNVGHLYGRLEKK